MRILRTNLHLASNNGTTLPSFSFLFFGIWIVDGTIHGSRPQFTLLEVSEPLGCHIDIVANYVTAKPISCMFDRPYNCSSNTHVWVEHTITFISQCKYEALN